MNAEKYGTVEDILQKIRLSTTDKRVWSWGVFDCTIRDWADKIEKTHELELKEAYLKGYNDGLKSKND